MSKKERDICQFKMDFWKCFYLRSNLSKDGRISTLRPGLKTGVENDINPNPTKSFQEYPPPPNLPGIKSFYLFLLSCSGLTLTMSRKFLPTNKELCCPVVLTNISLPNRGGSDLVIIRFLVEVPLKSFGFSFILVNSLSWAWQLTTNHRRRSGSSNT